MTSWTENDDPEPAPSLKLLGVRVVGPPPVDDVYFDLSDGFRALYGLNGAGKSRLLNAISDLLAGRRHGGGYVIVQLQNTQEVDRANPLVSGVLSSASRRFEEDRPALPLSRVIAEMLGDPDRDDDRVFALSSFLEDQGIWMLQPAGQEAGWYAVPGFLADEQLMARCELPPRLVSLLNGTIPTTDKFDDTLLNHPLLSCGAVASAVATGNEQATVREAAALARSALRPYPLVSWDHPRAHTVGPSVQVADVVTNRELTPEAVIDNTRRLVDQRLLELGEMPLEEAIEGVGKGDRELDEEVPTPVSSFLWVTSIAEQLSETASDLLSKALPGDLHADCLVVPDPGSDVLLSWRVSGEQHEDLELTDLSDAQRRWTCLAIAYATNHHRRRQYVEDREYERADDSELEEDREWLEQRVAELQRQIRDLQRVEEELGDESDSPDSEEQSGLAEEDAHDGVDHFDSEDHAELVDELAELEAELRSVEADLEALGSGDDSSEPTEARIAAALKRQFKLMPISLFLDEPEAGLHRTAERGVVQLLHSIARQQGFPVTVATHSPTFLEPDGAEPVLVHRGDRGFTAIEEGPGVLQRTAASLGVSSLDRLGLYRTILLVEGRHDEIVLREFFSEELERLRVLVLPLHGGRLMPTAADSLLLADFSDHRVVAMVDNADQRVFERLVRLARSLVPGDEQAYLDGSKEILAADKRDEHVFIARLIGRAHSQGLLQRFGAIALTKGDILEYLPVEHFVEGAESWEALHELYEQQKNIRPFKTWAARKQHGDFSDAAVEQACRSMDSVHRDLQRVLSRLDTTDSDR